MACRLFGAKPMRVIVNWMLRNKLLWNFIQSTKCSIHKNASENIICKMATILPEDDELKSPIASFKIHTLANNCYCL